MTKICIELAAPVVDGVAPQMYGFPGYPSDRSQRLSAAAPGAASKPPNTATVAATAPRLHWSRISHPPAFAPAVGGRRSAPKLWALSPACKAHRCAKPACECAARVASAFVSGHPPNPAGATLQRSPQRRPPATPVRPARRGFYVPRSASGTTGATTREGPVLARTLAGESVAKLDVEPVEVTGVVAGQRFAELDLDRHDALVSAVTERAGRSPTRGGRA